MFLSIFPLVISLSLAIPILHAQSFQHPGLLNNKVELDDIKAKVIGRVEPYWDSYNKMIASTYGKLTYTHQAFAEVQCGSYNNPNVGCNQIVENGIAAYTHALLWYITGNKAYAIKSIQIINAWSAVYQKNTESNSRLVVSWSAPWYTNAAEILRASDSGWSETEIEQFKGMLRRFLPYTLDETMPGNNWVMCAIEAHMSIAIFLDDNALFDQACVRWRQRLPTYIYDTKDGLVPITMPGRTAAQTYNTWRDDAVSTAFISGLGMETCRDLGHLKLGFNSLMYAGEMAYQQGVDLFTPEKNRIANFLELHAAWMLGEVAVPSNICGGKVRVAEPDANGIKPPTGGGATSFEIAYNHIANRLKVELPITSRMNSMNRPVIASKWVLKWETLTHANKYYTVTNLDQITDEVIHVYPNPSNNGSYQINKACNYTITNMAGMVVAKSNSASIDLSEQPAGLYFFRANGKQVKLIKI